MLSVILVIVGIVYCIVPDFFPGPIDDILVLLFTLFGADKAAK